MNELCRIKFLFKTSDPNNGAFVVKTKEWQWNIFF